MIPPRPKESTTYTYEIAFKGASSRIHIVHEGTFTELDSDTWSIICRAEASGETKRVLLRKENVLYIKELIE